MNQLKIKRSPLSDVINRAVAGSGSHVLEAKNSISAKGELLLYGTIGDWWEGNDALSIVRQLEALPGNEIVVRIQSGGGNVTEGLAMYNQLKQSSKRVIVYIDGIAASMACAVAMAGDVVYIPSNAIMMMHKPLLNDVSGNENDFLEMASALAQLGKSYVQLISDKTGKSTDEVAAVIADGKDHLFIGQEAVDFGLADELIQTIRLEAVAQTKFAGLNLPATASASLFTKPASNQPAAAAVTNQEDSTMWVKIKARNGGWVWVPAVSAALTGTFQNAEAALKALAHLGIKNLDKILSGEAEADELVMGALAKHFGIELQAPAQGSQAPGAQAQAGQIADAQAAASAAVAAERNRISDISALATQHRIPDADRDSWINGGLTAIEARAKALEVIAARDAASSPTSIIRTGSHVGREGMREAMANAMLNRIAPAQHKLTDNGREFRGMTIVGMIAEALAAQGQNVRGQTPAELVAAAMHTTSDFPLILQDVANKTLRAAYALAPTTYKAVAQQTSASDFKLKHSLQIGGGSDLQKVNESGEFTQGSVSEGGESYKLETYGKIFNFSRQLLINDDLGALNRFMLQAGSAAGRKENAIVWGLVKANPTLSDSVAVYSTNAKRANQFTGTAINDTTLSAGRKAMRQMKGLDGEAIAVLAKFLVVNSERETEAEKMLTAILANASSDVNVFANKMQLIVEPLLDGVSNNPWYMFADPMAVPCLEYCYLDGEQGPYTETKWGFEVDGMSLKVRHDFGAGFVDFRGTVKCTGA